MEGEIVQLMLRKQSLTEIKTKELQKRLEKTEKEKRKHQLTAFAYRKKELQWKRGQRTIDNPHGDLPATGFSSMFRQQLQEAEAEKEEKKKRKEQEKAQQLADAKTRKRAQQEELPRLELNPKKRRVPLPPLPQPTQTEVPASL